MVVWPLTVFQVMRLTWKQRNQRVSKKTKQKTKAVFGIDHQTAKIANIWPTVILTRFS